MSLTLLLLLAPAAASAAINVTFAGNPIRVWSAVDTLHKCHFIDVPDIPARAFDDDKGVTHMLVGSTNYHHMSGESILDQTRECATAWNESANPDPAMFAGDEVSAPASPPACSSGMRRVAVLRVVNTPHLPAQFLDSTIAFENGTVISLIHTEYPGNVYNNTGPDAPMCTIHPYPTCWTVTIGLAISHNWGQTWEHARPPPHHLVAAVPYGYNQSQLAYGWGDPSNIVKHPTDGFYCASVALLRHSSARASSCN